MEDDGQYFEVENIIKKKKNKKEVTKYFIK